MQLSERDRWMLDLAENRAKLLDAYCGISEAQLDGVADEGGWTLAQIFAHVAAWERRVADLLPLILASDAPAIPAADAAAMDRRAFEDIAARGFAAVLGDLNADRRRMLATLAAASDEAIARERRLPSGKPFTIRGWAIQELADHEGEHASHARATRKMRGAKRSVGPKPVLEAAFAASHDFLMACAAQVPPGQEDRLAVTGDWMLKDVLGHVADWHATIADSMDGALEGKPLTRVQFAKIQEFNDAHAVARRDQTWERARDDYERAWRRVNEALARVSQADLARPAIENERGPVTMAGWLYVVPMHELEHGEFLRDWMRSSV